MEPRTLQSNIKLCDHRKRYRYTLVSSNVCDKCDTIYVCIWMKTILMRGVDTSIILQSVTTSIVFELKICTTATNS